MRRRATVTVPAEEAGDGAGHQEEAPPGRLRSPWRGLLAVLLVLVGASAAGASATGSAPSATVVGGNLPVNAGAVDPRDTSAHNSPTVVHDPTNAANVVVANRIDLPSFSCALHVSLDGGVTWSQTPLPVPEGEEPKCYAPDAAYGADGTLYVSFVTLAGEGNVPNAVWLSHSTDQGRNLSDPVKVLGPLAFQVRLVADPVAPGRLYRSWLQAEAVALYAFPETGNPILFSRSDDGGLTWRKPVPVSDASRERVIAPSIDAGPGGRLYVLYLDLGDDRLDYAGGHEGIGGPPYGGTWQLVLARSSDRGVTWTETVVEDRVVPTERFIVFIPPSPSVAAAPSGSRVYVGFHDGRSGDADVLVWRSGDGGATFGPPVRVNDTPRRDGVSQYLPKLDVAGDGRLDVVYYDRRADRRDVMNQVSLQSSFDGGRTFTRSLRLADRSFDSRLGFGSDRGMPDLGSRLGLVSAPGRSLAVWTDTRSGTPRTPKQDVVRALVDISSPEGPSGVTRDALRWGGASAAAGGLALLLALARGRRRRTREGAGRGAGGAEPAPGVVA